MIYKITAGDFVYIGMTTRDLSQRITEHNYRLKDPEAHRRWSRNKLYTKLRSLEIPRITKENCVKICDGGREEEQIEMDKIQPEFLLNTARSCKSISV
jgi:hypothetical protein